MTTLLFLQRDDTYTYILLPANYAAAVNKPDVRTNEIVNENSSRVVNVAAAWRLPFFFFFLSFFPNAAGPPPVLEIPRTLIF